MEGERREGGREGGEGGGRWEGEMVDVWVFS